VVEGCRSSRFGLTLIGRGLAIDFLVLDRRNYALRELGVPSNGRFARTSRFCGEASVRRIYSFTANPCKARHFTAHPKRETAVNRTPFSSALIVGAGSGLSASLARLFSRQSMKVALAARDTAKLKSLQDETGAEAFACDATDRPQVRTLFEDASGKNGEPDVVVYNASGRLRTPHHAGYDGGPLIDLDPAGVERALSVAFGGFLVAQEAARRMLPKGRGAILFTGASASVKGYPQSAPFAMGKFALRGLGQSMARELAPQGIHVAHFVIDGRIASASRQAPGDKPDSLLDPDAIAESYLHVLMQPRSAWTWEVELRPWVERF
jgi:NAD(P)-dependent dehydrogenase (short-subunit alcohol dehydrogenase family)